MFYKLTLLCLLLHPSLTLAIDTFQVIDSKPEPSRFSPRAWENIENQILKTPNMSFSSGGNRSRFFQIRGIGEYSQYENFRQPTVGLFYNHIDLSDEPNALTTYSHQLYQLKTTSQSIEHGSRGMGGSLEVDSSSLSTEKSTELSIIVGNLNSRQAQAKLAYELSPLWQQLVRVHFLSSDGIMWNNVYQRPTGARREMNVELDNLWQRGQWSLRLFNLFTQHNNGYDHFTHNNSTLSISDRPGQEKLTTHGHSLHWQWDLGQHYLETITSLTSSEFVHSFDEDWGNNATWTNTPGWSQKYDYSSINQFKQHKIHQKAHYVLENGEFGLHGFSSQESLDHQGFENGLSRGQTTGESSVRSLALLGKYKALQTDTFLWQQALRIEKQWRSLKGPVIQSDQDLLWSLRSTKQFSLSANSSIEVQLNRSYRGGGYNLETAISPSQRRFEPEAFYSSDVALKRQQSFGRQQFKLFYHHREDQQLRTSFQDDPQDPSSFTTITQNSGSSKAFGLELEQSAQWHWLTFRLQAASLFSQFISYDNPTTSLSGRDTPYSPRYGYRADFSFQLNSKQSIQVSFYGSEGFFLSTSHNQRTPPTHMVDLHYQFDYRRWGFGFFAQNLFDQKSSQRGFYFSNEPPDWQQSLYLQPGPPRYFGARLTYHF